MPSSSLPREILDVILQNLISDYTMSLDRHQLYPRWYLVPLLRVCKVWHLVGERHLYRSISIGSPFPRRPPGLRNSPAPPTRDPSLITDELVRTLNASSRLAALIEELQIRSRTDLFSETNTQLVDVCPNLRHVDLQFLHSDALYEALERKPLVSVRVMLLGFGDSLPIFDLMQCWPQIQTITVLGPPSIRLRGRADPQAPGALNCCPALREIVLDAGWPRERDFESVRWMCSAVAKFTVWVDCSDTDAVDAFCGCVRAWAPTLERLSVHVVVTPHPESSYRPISEALSSLSSLEELSVTFDLDVDAVSSLPRLKRLNLSPGYTHTEAVMDRLANLLEDPEKFAALVGVNVRTPRRRNRTEHRMLRDVCERRNIAVQM